MTYSKRNTILKDRFNLPVDIELSFIYALYNKKPIIAE
jgi:hypothetical protein